MPGAKFPERASPGQPNNVIKDQQLMETKTRGPYKNGIRRREQILDAAFVSFARNGYAGASMRGIAQKVGVAHSALVTHFASKEELLVAVLEKWEMALTEHSTAPTEGLGYFRALLDDVRYHLDHPGLVDLLMTTIAEGSRPEHPAHGWVRDRYSRLVREGSSCLRAARESGIIKNLTDDEIELEVRRLYGAMDGLQLQWLADPSIDLLAAFEAVLEKTIASWVDHSG